MVKWIFSIFARISIFICLVFLNYSLLSPTQAYEIERNQGRGILHLSWCTDPAGAKSKLLEKNNSACKRAYIRHGNRHENELGLSAIKEICLGNYQIAQDLIVACQCHNPGAQTEVWNEWETVVRWARNHPYCAQWFDWVRMAAECRESGGSWSDDGKRCNQPVVPPPPAAAFVVAAEIECRNSSNGGTGRLFPSANSNSCEVAAKELEETIKNRDLCAANIGTPYQMTSWRFINTGMCYMAE